MLWQIPDAALVGGSMVLASRSALEGAFISANIQSVICTGFLNAGDCPAITYKRVGDLPTSNPLSWVQSGDGAYWDIVGDSGVFLTQLGGVGDDATNSDDAVVAWFSLADRFPLYLDIGTFRYTTPITVTSNATIIGFGGRRQFDNSAEDNGAVNSSLHFVGLNVDQGLLFTIDVDNPHRVFLTLHDWSWRGPRVTPGASIAGDGVVFDGGQVPSVAVHFDISNFNVCEAHERGFVVTGAAYGNSAGLMECNRNGKSGIWVENSGADAIGETTFSQLRAFQNGTLGANIHEQTGIVMRPGASNIVGNMWSGSENEGAGIICQRGNYVVDGMQAESNRGNRQIIFGSDGGADLGVTFAVINSIMINPIANYTGVMLAVFDNCVNVQVTGAGLFGTLGVGGRHIFCNATKCSFGGIVTSVTLDAAVTSPTSFIAANSAFTNDQIPAVDSFADANIINFCGDGNDYNIVCNTDTNDLFGQYNNATGLCTVITPGWYYVCCIATVQGASAGHTSGALSMSITGGKGIIHRLGSVFGQAAAGTITYQVETLKYLNALDTIQPSINIGGGTKTITLVGGAGDLTAFKLIRMG